MNNIKKNFLYNIVYQIFILILPLISAPYISRVIGAEGLGTYSYTYSIVSYFVMFAMLGINNYGNRLIAQNRDDEHKMSKKFWSLYIMEFIITTIVLIAYIFFIAFIAKEDKIMYILQLGFILGSFFDINWFFFGLEEFKITVTRNTIIKILSFISMFIFVRKRDDLYIYTIILSVSNLISNIVLWPFVIKKVEKTKVSLREILEHLKPCIILFIPVIAISLYKKMDKIMLGIMSTKTEVGYYENAEKIISIPAAIISALGTVIAILSFTIIFTSWSNVIRTQYLIPKEKDKEYIGSVIVGAIVNLIFNILMIPKLTSVGACITTVMAEFSVMFIQTMNVRKELPIKEYMKKSFKYLIKSLIMFAIIYIIQYLKLSKFFIIILQVIIGCMIYFILNYKYIINLIKKKV